MNDFIIYYFILVLTMEIMKKYPLTKKFKIQIQTILPVRQKKCISTSLFFVLGSTTSISPTTVDNKQVENS
jgi:hypothetical protein